MAEGYIDCLCYLFLLKDYLQAYRMAMEENMIMTTLVIMSTMMTILTLYSIIPQSNLFIMKYALLVSFQILPALWNSGWNGGEICFLIFAASFLSFCAKHQRNISENNAATAVMKIFVCMLY